MEARSLQNTSTSKYSIFFSGRNYTFDSECCDLWYALYKNCTFTTPNEVKNIACDYLRLKAALKAALSNDRKFTIKGHKNKVC